jgi:SAM-dependent methyltransferase
MYQKVVQIVNEKINLEKAYQEEYDTFLRYENPGNIIRYNGFLLTETEEKIIGNLLGSIDEPTVVDVGCADGRRLFPYLEKKNARIIGIEKAPNICLQAPLNLRKYIYCLSITNTLKLRSIVMRNSVDLVTILGLAIGGIHEENSRHIAFKNISYMLKKGGYFLIEAYKHDDYEEKDRGLAMRFKHDIPYQYLPSRKELVALAEQQGLFFVEEKDSLPEDKNIGAVFLTFKKIH